MNEKAVAGIDIGGTKIAVALETLDGKKLASRHLPTKVELGPYRIMEDVARTLRRMLKKTPESELVAIGIGCPAPLDIERGLVCSPSNLRDWIEFPLVKMIENTFDVKTLLDNDANVAALGEFYYGAGRGFENILYVTISTGIGGAIINRGKIIQGIGGAAGEIGHTIVMPTGGEICGCGGRGCLETVGSGKSIARRARERLASGGETSLMRDLTGNDLNAITAEIVVEAVKRGDRIAQEIWDEACRFIAVGIGNAINLIAPEAVIIGGGVSSAGELLLEPLRKLLKENVRLIPTEKISIKRAALGKDSGVCGALVLARDWYLNQNEKPKRQSKRQIIAA
ncbi:MAG: ROK family protein [Pyrinomonadaceae bacterium]